MESDFAAFNIFVSASFADIDPEKVKLSFVANVFIEGGNVWWTHAGGSSGGDLQSFLTRLRLDQHFVFGPPRQQQSWPIEKLEEIGAVGVYQSKESNAKTAP
jgi:hypothetical protein